jgi:hypothetical protein
MTKIFFNAAPPHIAAHRAQFPRISPKADYTAFIFCEYQVVSVIDAGLPDERRKSAAEIDVGRVAKVSQNRILRAVLRGMDVLPPRSDFRSEPVIRHLHG